jgi:[acyl-carrier-protein] S-malonyltransferase
LIGTIKNVDFQGAAFLFPGQGAQAVGMGAELYHKFESVKNLFHDVDEAIGVPLSRIFMEGPEEELRRTINAQPAILVVSLACLMAFRETIDSSHIPHPSYMAGHSLGEYTALVAAGSISPTDAAVLVRERGRLMQEASDRVPSGMAAIIGLDESVVEAICQETGTQVSNVNSPEQLVIAGERLALARALDLATVRGAKRAIPLRVSGAFHSVLMDSAMIGIQDVIQETDFKDPIVPIVANSSAKPLTKKQEIKEELVRQICNCVQWKNSVDFMVNSGVSHFIEIGPGQTLSGLVKRICDGAHTDNLNDLSSVQSFNLDWKFE